MLWKQRLVKCKEHAVKFLRDEEGASGIEYALIAVMVAVVIALFVPDIKEAITNVFTQVKNGLTSQ